MLRRVLIITNKSINQAKMLNSFFIDSAPLRVLCLAVYVFYKQYILFMLICQEVFEKFLIFLNFNLHGL